MPQLQAWINIFSDFLKSLYTTTMTGLLDVINHYLIDIVTRPSGEIPSGEINTNGFIDIASKQSVQGAFFAAFSTLGPNPSNQAIREGYDMLPGTEKDTALTAIAIIAGILGLLRLNRKSFTKKSD